MNDKVVIVGDKQTIVPEGVKYITADMIENEWGIEELFLPSTLEKVEPKAFDGLKKLRKLTMPAKFLKPYDEDDEWRLRDKVFGTYALFSTFFSTYDYPSFLEEIVVYGDEKEIDLSMINWQHFIDHIKNKGFIFRIENEVVEVKLPKDQYKQYCPNIYINNSVENVKFSTPTKWTQEQFSFRAPKPNERVLEANAIELTLAPRETYGYNDSRWSCPITINCSAVSYITPVEIACYESDKYQGTELLLLGERLDEEALANLHLGDYPRVLVWEDKETVYKKLLAKGW